MAVVRSHKSNTANNSVQLTFLATWAILSEVDCEAYQPLCAAIKLSRNWELHDDYREVLECHR